MKKAKVQKKIPVFLRNQQNSQTHSVSYCVLIILYHKTMLEILNHEL